MSPAPFLYLLSAWMWLSLGGAGLMVLQGDTGSRFWALLLAAATSWVSHHLFQTHLARTQR